MSCLGGLALLDVRFGADVTNGDRNRVTASLAGSLNA